LAAWNARRYADIVEADKLAQRIDPQRDHILGDSAAPVTLVEHGSYACENCHAAHQVVAGLRDRSGDRLRYIYRHFPLRRFLTARILPQRRSRSFLASIQACVIGVTLLWRPPTSKGT
jgi:hypothetical protein